uniref:Uncharacterized protein n=1 Tax=Panagrolaimus sp. JU765 TaxID=591449 RepID=A0AC34QW29_9BILA
MANEDLPTNHKVTAFWFHVCAIFCKIVAVSLLAVSRFRRQWFTNTNMLPNYLLSRDIFGTDCAYNVNDTNVVLCYDTNELYNTEGINFWAEVDGSIDDVMPTPRQIVVANHLFSFLCFFIFIDLISTFVTCYFTDRFLPTYEMTNTRKGWNYGAKYVGIFAVIALLIILVYCMITFVVFYHRSSSFTITNSGLDGLGNAFHIFCLSTIFFFCGQTCLSVAYVFYIKANGGICKEYSEGQPLQTLRRNHASELD